MFTIGNKCIKCAEDCEGKCNWILHCVQDDDVRQ